MLRYLFIMLFFSFYNGCGVQLRKQAATELRALKAELVQKKNQSPGASLGLGTNMRDKPQV